MARKPVPTTTIHPASQPVSYGTYTNHACRCPGCVEAQAAYKREWHARSIEQVRRQRRIEMRAKNLGAKWLRRNHPAEWKRMLAAARLEEEVREAERAAAGADS